MFFSEHRVDALKVCVS